MGNRPFVGIPDLLLGGSWGDAEDGIWKARGSDGRVEMGVLGFVCGLTVVDGRV